MPEYLIVRHIDDEKCSSKENVIHVWMKIKFILNFERIESFNGWNARQTNGEMFKNHTTSYELPRAATLINLLPKPGAKAGADK